MNKKIILSVFILLLIPFSFSSHNVLFYDFGFETYGICDYDSIASCTTRTGTQTVSERYFCNAYSTYDDYIGDSSLDDTSNQLNRDVSCPQGWFVDIQTGTRSCTDSSLDGASCVSNGLEGNCNSGVCNTPQCSRQESATQQHNRCNPIASCSDGFSAFCDEDIQCQCNTVCENDDQCSRGHECNLTSRTCEVSNERPEEIIPGQVGSDEYGTERIKCGDTYCAGESCCDTSTNTCVGPGTLLNDGKGICISVEESDPSFLENIVRTFLGENTVNQINQASGNNFVDRVLSVLLSQSNVLSCKGFGNSLTGTGTESSPCRIDTPDQLNKLRESQNRDRHFFLGNNISLGGFSNWDPIGDNSNSFTGSLDGRNFTISNLYIARPTENYNGLFGYINNAEIENLRLVLRIDVLEGTRAEAYEDVNGLTQYISVIDYDANAENDNNKGNYTGGLAGYARNSNITRVDVFPDIEGFNHVGGITGYLENSVINDSISSPGVQGINRTGGITGTSMSSNITNSRVISDVDFRITEEHNFVGGVLGFGNNTNIDNVSSLGIDSIYFDGDWRDVYRLDIDFQNSWRDFWEVYTFTGDNVGGIAGYLSNSNVSDSSGGRTLGLDNVGGVVGNISNTTIDNTSGGSTNGRDYLGGIAGFANNSMIINSRGSLTSSYGFEYQREDEDSDYIGGVVGYGNNSNITNVIGSSVDIVGDSSRYAGGIAGYVNNSTIHRADGSRAEADAGADYLGGVVGYGHNSIITESSGATVDAENHVTADYSNYLGGIAGRFDGNVTNVYSSGSVRGSEVGSHGSDNVGGLFGSLNGNLSYAYSTGNVYGDDNIDQLIGTNAGSRNCNNVYADEEGDGTRCGTVLTNPPNCAKGGFIDWDINIWDFQDNGFPLLRHFTGNTILETCDDFTSGSGTQSDPYLIFSSDDLIEMGNYPNSHFALASDINLSSVSWDSFNFNGVLDGRGYEISDFRLNNNDNNNISLFSNLSNSEITNITLRDFVINSTDTYTANLAALAINVNSSTISDISIENSYITGSRYLSTLAININDSDISNVSVTNGYLEGGNDIGGIVRRLDDSNISTSSFNGTINSTSDNIAGIADISDDIHLRNVYTNVNFVNQIGSGIVNNFVNGNEITNSYSVSRGRAVDVGSQINQDCSNTYFDSTISEQTASNCGSIGKTTSELQSPTSNTGIYSSWSTSIWDFGTSTEYPTLRG